MKPHKTLEAWKQSFELVKDVYRVTSSFPSEEKFGLISQLRRAAVSIPTNIAEGAARKSALERKRFYEVARSSDVEVDNCLEVILASEYFDKKEIAIAEDLVEQIFRLLSAMIDNTK